MSLLKPEEPYDANDAKTSVLQPKIQTRSLLRRPRFKNRIVSEEGWSISFSGSSWRIDRYDYWENGRHLVLSGEGGTGAMEVVIPQKLVWDDPPNEELDNQTRTRVLENLTSALQWAGFSVGFFLD
jgi:hypothetical protein